MIALRDHFACAAVTTRVPFTLQLVKNHVQELFHVQLDYFFSYELKLALAIFNFTGSKLRDLHVTGGLLTGRRVSIEGLLRLENLRYNCMNWLLEFKPFGQWQLVTA